ncbi:hypothetical protein HKCCE3408_01100 [Rhodobacterales bacterium HKCCE3408]|nr:hypothetical protein [Rhodobacterales bacterium HKCCE3408]
MRHAALIALVIASTTPGALVAQTTLDLTPATRSDQDSGPGEVAELAELLLDFRTFDRISGDLAHLQSLALLSQIYGWEAPSHDGSRSYSGALMHAIGSTEIEAVDARRGIETNPAASELDLIAVRGILRDMRRLRATASQVHLYLANGRIADAAALYHAETVPLRQQIQNAAITAVTLTAERLSGTR